MTNQGNNLSMRVTLAVYHGSYTKTTQRADMDGAWLLREVADEEDGDLGFVSEGGEGLEEAADVVIAVGVDGGGEDGHDGVDDDEGGGAVGDGGAEDGELSGEDGDMGPVEGEDAGEVGAGGVQAGADGVS